MDGRLLSAVDYVPTLIHKETALDMTARWLPCGVIKVYPRTLSHCPRRWLFAYTQP